jgi:hypothetical protein
LPAFNRTVKPILLLILLLCCSSSFAQQYGVEDTTYKRHAVYALPKDAIKVFPNPVVNDLYITVKLEGLLIKTVFLYDKDGNRIIEQKINSNLSAPVKLNLGNYHPGIYYLVLETNMQPFRMQLIRN